MGIAAVCAIGGAGKWRRYGYPNYLDDLMGSSVVLVPDRDAKGMAHMEDIQKDFPDAQWLYPYPDSALWNKLPEKGGLDIADWIEDFKLSKVQILDAVGNIPKAIGSNTKKQEIPQEAIANLKEATSLYLEEFPMTFNVHPLVTTFDVAHA